MAVGKGKRCLGIQLDDVYGLERGCTTGIVDVLLFNGGGEGRESFLSIEFFSTRLIKQMYVIGVCGKIFWDHRVYWMLYN